MSFVDRINKARVKAQSAITAARQRQEAAAEARAKRELESARTNAAKYKARQALKQEKYRIKKEVAEARIATNKAAQAAKKARIEAGDIGITDQLIAGFKKLSASNNRSSSKCARRPARGEATMAKMSKAKRSAAAKKAWRTRKRKYGKDGKKG